MRIEHIFFCNQGIEVVFMSDDCGVLLLKMGISDAVITMPMSINQVFKRFILFKQEVIEKRDIFRQQQSIDKGQKNAAIYDYGISF